METPGLMLKREREARGMTLGELAKITRIPVSALENIENNAFDSFPAEVFVRGFLRNYARQLDIPASEIMAAYENLQSEQKPQAEIVETPVLSVESHEADEIEADNDDMPRFSFRFAYIAIILIAVASVGMSVLFMGTGEAEESDMDFSIQADENMESPFLISNTSEGWIAE
jgi:cytoskeletal protein RodZ